MTEHNYTDEEVIKALEYHSDPSKPCVQKCVYGDQRFCGSKMAKDALDLINRQKAEISVLTSAVDNSTKEFLKLHDKYQEQKAEIERLQKAYTKGQEIFSEQCLENERLKVEIDRLEAMIDAAEEHFAPLPFKNKFDEYIEKSKAEAIKKFSERLKKECLFDRGYEILQEGTIDHLVKEFTEEKT